MNQKVNLLFPTPLIETNIGTDYIIKDVNLQRGPNNDGYISVDEKYLDSNKKLKDRIDNEIEIYLRHTLRLNRKVYLKHQASWILLHKKGDHSPIHYHQNSWLSGIYYYKVSKNSGLVQFNCDRPYGWTCSSMNPLAAAEEINEITANWYRINPAEGHLILFPSQLSHLSFPNETDEDRIALSFNYTLHGTWGVTTTRITI